MSNITPFSFEKHPIRVVTGDQQIIQHIKWSPDVVQHLNLGVPA